MVVVYVSSNNDFVIHHAPQQMDFEDISRDAEGTIAFYVRNLKDSNLTLSEVYVDGVLDSGAIGDGLTLLQDETVKINLTYPNTNNQIKIKVVTDEGSFMELTKTFYRIRIQNYEWNKTTGQIKVYVKNAGVDDVILSEVYMNGTLDSAAVFTPKTLVKSQLSVVTLSGGYVSFPNTNTVIRVVTDQGYAADITGLELPTWIWIGGMGMQSGSAEWNSTSRQIKVHLTCGLSGVTVLSDVYVNGTLDASAVFSQRELGFFESAELTLSAEYLIKPDAIEVAVFNTEGRYGIELLTNITETS
jgi:hypothetical protein